MDVVLEQWSGKCIVVSLYGGGGLVRFGGVRGWDSLKRLARAVLSFGGSERGPPGEIFYLSESIQPPLPPINKTVSSSIRTKTPVCEEGHRVRNQVVVVAAARFLMLLIGVGSPFA